MQAQSNPADLFQSAPQLPSGLNEVVGDFTPEELALFQEVEAESQQRQMALHEKVMAETQAKDRKRQEAREWLQQWQS